MTREGIERALVRAAKQHAAILIKDVLRTIPMMHIPIDDGNLLSAMLLLRMSCSNGDVIK